MRVSLNTAFNDQNGGDGEIDAQGLPRDEGVADSYEPE
jgi:hypothetical protein